MASLLCAAATVTAAAAAAAALILDVCHHGEVEGAFIFCL